MNRTITFHANQESLKAPFIWALEQYADQIGPFNNVPVVVDGIELDEEHEDIILSVQDEKAAKGLISREFDRLITTWDAVMRRILHRDTYEADDDAI